MFHKPYQVSHKASHIDEWKFSSQKKKKIDTTLSRADGFVEYCETPTWGI